MKKWIALWSALLMMISILPVMPVSAEEVSALEQAKLCIDTILTALHLRRKITHFRKNWQMKWIN